VDISVMQQFRSQMDHFLYTIGEDIVELVMEHYQAKIELIPLMNSATH
jgi:hypothetical protein